MKITFLLALLSAAATLAASNPVLVPGEPPLLRSDLTKITACVEWTLEARFTPDERERFERTQIDAWNHGDAQFRLNLITLAKTYDTVRALPPAQMAQVRQQMQTSFVDKLRHTPDNAGSRLMLAVYNREHGLDVRQGSNLPAPALTAIPPELVGSWTSLHASTVTYRNPSTGSYAPPSGSGMSYKIFPDGRYESSGLIQSSLYSCTITVNAFEEGVLRIDGSTVVFDSKGGTLDTKDTCRSSGNKRKALAANQKSYTWRMTKDQYTTYFCIANAGVKEECARRQ